MEKPPSRNPMGGFIRFPPDEMDIEEARSNPLFVEIDRLPEKDQVLCYLINWSARDFDEGANPVWAFQAFFRSVEYGVYPPLKVLRWMAAALRQYDEAEGTKSLDKCFGTQGPASGTDPAFKKLIRERRNDRAMSEMNALMAIGATRLEAAEMVAAKMSAQADNVSPLKLKPLDAGTLETYHKRHAYKSCTAQTKEWIMGKPELIRRLLAEYPAVPDRLKRKHEIKG